MEDKNKKPEIPPTTVWLMFGVAIFFDIISLLSLIPFIGWILEVGIWIFAAGTFWLWFMNHGINIFSFGKPRKAIASIAAYAVEVTPLGFIPSWTALVWYLTKGEKILDKVASQVPGGKNIVNSVLKK